MNEEDYSEWLPKSFGFSGFGSLVGGAFKLLAALSGLAAFITLAAILAETAAVSWWLVLCVVSSSVLLWWMGELIDLLAAILRELRQANLRPRGR